MIKYAPFDQSQVDYLRAAETAWLSVLEGGVRAGKNVLNILAWCQTIENHPDKLHLAGGVTKATVMMNIIDSNGFGVEHYFSGRCKPGKYNKMECLYVYTATGEKVIIISGGKDCDDFRPIKGNTYGSVYITEANECHESFIKTAINRTLSSNKRQIIFDLNPKPPRHWFYVDILDFQDVQKEKGLNPGYNWAHMTIWNNHAFTNSKIKEVLMTYDKTSLWYQADVLGKRTAATGRIYTGYKTSDVVLTSKQISEMNFRHFSIGVDVGGTDATVATLVGFTKGFEETCLIDGYYHKQGKTSGMDHAKYAKNIVDKITEWVDTYPFLSTSTVFAESADKLFRQALTNALKEAGLHRMVVLPAYKKDGIVDRIRLQNILINQGRFFIAKHLKHWVNAYESAMWSDDDYEKGEWVRVDDGSYEVDCLDSNEYGVQPFKEQLLRRVA